MSDYNNVKSRYVIQLEALSSKGAARKVELSGHELGEIAERLHVPAISSVSAGISITKKGKRIRVEGKVKAQLTRICVTSLEELEEYIDEVIDLNLLITSKPSQARTAPDLDVVIADDEPEPFWETELDLKEITIQQLSLAMDPYPRKEGATPVKDERDHPSLSPFSVLEQLKDQPPE